MASSLSSVFMVALLVGTVLLGFASAADPDPLVDFVPVPGQGDEQFKFNLQATAGLKGPGGLIQPANVGNFPALNSQGLSIVRFGLIPCGQNQPHTHPRASEILFLVSGGPLLVGFVDTNLTAHLNVLRPGDVTVFPRGLIHFQQNFGKENAVFIGALNSQNPGVQPVAPSFFKLPIAVVSTALNIDLNTPDAANVHDQVPTNGAPTLGRGLGCVPGKLPPGIDY